MLHMTALFQCFSTHISEDHKLYIVQENLLPRYAVAVAPLGLRTLGELSAACRVVRCGNVGIVGKMGIHLKNAVDPEQGCFVLVAVKGTQRPDIVEDARETSGGTLLPQGISGFREIECPIFETIPAYKGETTKG